MAGPTLVIGGVTIDRVAARVTLGSVYPYVRGGVPSFTFSQSGVTLTSAVHPYDGQTAALYDPFANPLVIGDVASRLTHYDTHLGWVYEFICYGYAQRCMYIPVTDSNTLTDTAKFNLPSDDADYIASRAGRTVGQIILDVLEMPQNKVPLFTAVPGAYTGAGAGAAATCVLAAGSGPRGVGSTITVTSAGTGYLSSPSVRFSGGGGSGATATAAHSGGGVTTITLTAAGTGYTSPPIVILSTLSSNTLADLDTLAIIPPFEFDVSGERILQAIEGMIQTCHPNHFLHIDPDNQDIRILDPRTFAATITLTLDGSDHRVDPATLSVNTDYSQCFSRCLVRGNSLVLPYTLDTLPYQGSAETDGGLVSDFAHDGLTEMQAIAQWNPNDYQQPLQSPGTAVGNAVLSGSTVGSISVQYGGSGYTSPPTVALSGGGGSGATATATLTSGVVTSFSVTAAGSSYTSAPTVLCTGPAVGQSMVGTISAMADTLHVTLSSADPSSQFAADHWDQTDSGRHGVLVLRRDAITDFTQYFTAQVVANTAMTAGGTASFQLAVPAPAVDYTSFQLFGTSGGANVVYRRYKPSNTDIAARMANYFPYPMAYRNSDNTSASLTSTPKCTVFYSPSGVAPYEQLGLGVALDPVAGTVLTARPTSLVFSADGKTITPVDNVQVFLPVHVGALQTVYPPDVMSAPAYAGTLFSVLGIGRTKTISVNDWRDTSNSSNMNLMASEFLDSFKNIVIEGSITYHGFLAQAINFNRLLTISGNPYDVPALWAGIPITSCEITFNERGGATNYSTVIGFSNRRMPISGASFARPAVVGQAFGSDSGFGASGRGLNMGSAIEGIAGTMSSLLGPQASQQLGEQGLNQMAGNFLGGLGSQSMDMGLGRGPDSGGFGSTEAAMGALASNSMAAQGLATNPLQSLAMQGADPFAGQNQAFNVMAARMANDNGEEWLQPNAEPVAPVAPPAPPPAPIVEAAGPKPAGE